MSRGSASPTLTVGVAVYNSDPGRLERSLGSVLAQTFADFRVVICDNSPDDRTRDLCMAYVERDDRVTYTHNQVNVGAYPSFWRSMQIADSPYFKWVADDDALAPEYFARCLEVLESDPTVALCYSRVRMIEPDGTVLDDGTIAGIEATQDHAPERFVAVLNFPWLAVGYYGIYRTRMMRRMHPVSEDCVRLADILQLAETALYGKIRQLPQALLTYTRNDKDWDDREKLNAAQYATCFPRNPHRGVTFPNLAFAAELLEAVRWSDLPLDEKSRLYDVVPTLVRDRISALWLGEIRRAVALVLQHRVVHNWGDPVSGPEALDMNAMAQTLPGAVRFHAGELLCRFEQVMQLWPQYPEPGVHSARAVLLVMLNRMVEAEAALQVELVRFPDYAPAVRMLENLRAASRQMAMS